mmetsp:Transcript_35433/g.69366  ORF Transcript_35433/g.69366 Transcript_35433/m.69366 type:complete len:80 (-) Transcript_35433:126-365(-)
MSECDSFKMKLLKCISTSECAERGGSQRECVQSDDIPDECKALRNAFIKCRRGQFDARARLQGNKWAGAGTAADRFNGT